MFKRTIIRLQHTVSPTFFPVQLVAIAFCTGILDATTYADFQTFASNQTGNAILLPVGMMGAANVQMLNTGTSLASFLFFGFLSGQVGHIFGHRKRWWMLLSLFIQALLLFLLATSAGFQVAMARNLGVNEIPTAMLTSPFIDFVTDRYLFTGKGSIDIPALWGGAFVGACMHRYSGSKEVILMVGCMKLGVMASFWFNREEEHKNEIESHETVMCSRMSII